MGSFAVAFLAAAALLVGSGPVHAQRGGTEPARPHDTNLLVIVLDDVGTDKLSSFDEIAAPPYARTPRIGRLAEHGVRFQSFYVNPICSASRALFMTGRYAFRTGMGSNTETWELPDSEVLLPELLRTGLPPTKAYRCGAFGKWHLGDEDPAHAVRNGFHRFYGTLGNAPQHFAWDKFEQDEGSPPSGPIPQSTWSASVARADAVRWINEQEHPFFAYVAFNPPHGEWVVPPLDLLSDATRGELRGYAEGQEAQGTRERQLFYRAMLEAVDTDIGRLLDGLDPLKLARTTIFLVCDNGSPAQVIQLPHVPSHAKPSAYQLGIRVPMIVSGALVPPAVEGRECLQLVQGVDLWPTIAAITGADEALAFRNSGYASPYPPIDGVSFLPSILDPAAQSQRPWAFSQFFGPGGPYQSSQCLSFDVRAITDGQYKYLRWSVKPPGVPLCAFTPENHELYRIDTDPEETTNLLRGTLAPAERSVLEYLRTEMDVLSSAPGHASR